MHTEQTGWSLRASGTSLWDGGRGRSSHGEGLDHLRLGSISPLSRRTNLYDHAAEPKGTEELKEAPAPLPNKNAGVLIPGLKGRE